MHATLGLPPCLLESFNAVGLHCQVQRSGSIHVSGWNGVIQSRNEQVSQAIDVAFQSRLVRWKTYFTEVATPIFFESRLLNILKLLSAP